MAHAPQIGKVRDISQKMRLYRGDEELAPITFLIGAGCSVSAGIPVVEKISKGLVTELAVKHGMKNSTDPKAALSYLTHRGMLSGHAIQGNPATAKTDWGGVYDTIFADIYSSPDDSRDIFKKIIRDAKPKINWAHLALGELAKSRWVSTSITTNFDLLALEGYARAGVIPVVSDGIESLDRIDPKPEFPQLIQINGSIHTYRLRNGPDDLDQVEASDAAITCFRSLFQSTRVLVVVGYEGREPQIMKLRIEAAKSFPDKHVFWSMYSQNPKDLSNNAQEFLSHSQNARLIPGQDADLFFMELCKELELHAPLAIRDPIGFHEELLDRTFDPSELKGLEPVSGEIDALREKLKALRKCEATTLLLGLDEASLESSAQDGPPSDASSEEKQAWEILNRIKRGAPNQKLLFSRLREVQDEWYEKGRTHGTGDDLKVSAEIAKRLLEIADTPSQRSIAGTDLGFALLELGELGQDTGIIEESISVIKAALSEVSRDVAPADWARLQDNLGSALLTLGDREESNEYLEDALVAYRSALEERTREKSPLDWAKTQSHLGNNLLSIGISTNNTDRMREALVAFRLSIQERRRDRMPLEWASSQNNLANALSVLGSYELDTSKIKEAIDVYTVALEEYTRDRLPLDWAKTHENLAKALVGISEIDDDPSVLVKSLIHAKEALEAYEATDAKAYAVECAALVAQIEAAIAESET